MRSYVDRGYIIVQQDVRGRYMSEGEFMHVRPAGFGSVDETTDSYDTVDWLVKNIPGQQRPCGFRGRLLPGILRPDGRFERASGREAFRRRPPLRTGTWATTCTTTAC